MVQELQVGTLKVKQSFEITIFVRIQFRLTAAFAFFVPWNWWVVSRKTWFAWLSGFTRSAIGTTLAGCTFGSWRAPVLSIAVANSGRLTGFPDWVGRTREFHGSDISPSFVGDDLKFKKFQFLSLSQG